MIIIIEGTEGAGKTTLAEYLSKSMGYPVVHRSKPNTPEEKQAMMQGYLDDINSGDNFIWDRCWYSEMVYGPIMRDQAYINMDQMYELEKMLAKKGGIIIHCTDEPENLWRRAQVRGEEYITDYSTLVALKERYDVLFHSISHKVPVVTYTI